MNSAWSTIAYFSLVSLFRVLGYLYSLTSTKPHRCCVCLLVNLKTKISWRHFSSVQCCLTLILNFRRKLRSGSQLLTLSNTIQGGREEEGVQRGKVDWWNCTLISFGLKCFISTAQRLKCFIIHSNVLFSHFISIISHTYGSSLNFPTCTDPYFIFSERWEILESTVD